jgi:hypothetical protein
MKDEFQPLEPVGHEATEARIVAWVQGEVSPAEAAELESLCAVRPDLEVFRKQIAELHSLLGEATTDAGWTLSAERRARLDAAFAGGAFSSASRKTKATGRWVRPVLLAAAACVTLAAGFHFIVTPLGNTRLGEKAKPLPSITALPRESKSPEDFRRETATAQANQEMSTRWVAPAAPATLAALDTSEDKILMDSSLGKEAQPFTTQIAQAPVDSVVKSDVAATAEMPAEAMAMAAPLKRHEVAKAKLPERQGHLAELNRAMQALPISQGGEWMGGSGSGGASGSWRFARLQKNAPPEEFEVRVSTAKEARGYQLASGETVKLLIEDGKDVECSQKIVTVGGKTMTIEAMLREALAGK